MRLDSAAVEGESVDHVSDLSRELQEVKHLRRQGEVVGDGLESVSCQTSGIKDKRE